MEEVMRAGELLSRSVKRPGTTSDWWSYRLGTGSTSLKREILPDHVVVQQLRDLYFEEGIPHDTRHYGALIALKDLGKHCAFL